jgi:hypothetical protein
MSKIEQYGRHWETFNPTSKEHRQIFHNALKHKTWGKSPIRFWLQNETTSLMDQCTKSMARFYMEKEFGKFLDVTLDEELSTFEIYKEQQRKLAEAEKQ